MRRFHRVLAGSLALALGLAAGPAFAQVCDLATNGTFRFLNSVFPQGTQNAEYTARLVVANADGTVTFSVAGTGDPLPSGLTLDANSGVITGLPASSGNDDVDFVANDGTQQITKTINIKISASGGGGNGGAEVSNNDFPDGRVGVAYSHTATVTNGVGPFTFAASDLPPGLTLAGSTGAFTGVPTTPGTYFMSLTVYDAGESNIGETVLPITILPALTDFRFVTQFLGNGEVGTPYCDQLEVDGAISVVTFGASGLPPGLSLDPLTGSVSGTATTPGTYLVSLSANDAGLATITTNLSVVIAPSAASNFHWNLMGLPAGLVSELYDRQPAITVAAEGAAGAVTYAATGLPDGIAYSATTGELSGTPTRAGEYPVVLTASDAGSSQTLTLSLFFVVLPATGGDVNQISVNLWVTKASLKLGTDGSESLSFSAIYNADRRAGNRFDPATDTFVARLGARETRVDPGEFVGDDQVMSFQTSDVVPAERVALNADRQVVSWGTSSDTLTEVVPGVLSHMVVIGDRPYRLLLSFDAKGGLKSALAFERTAFVLSAGSLKVEGPGLDAAKLSLLLSDRALSYVGGVSTLRMRILDGATVLFDRDFTALGGPATNGVDSRTGKPTIAFKTLTDLSLTDRIALQYSSSKGAIKLSLSAMNLAAISDGAANLTFELTIGARVYTTDVTFFEASPGSYSLAIP